MTPSSDSLAAGHETEQDVDGDIALDDRVETARCPLRAHGFGDSLTTSACSMKVTLRPLEGMVKNAAFSAAQIIEATGGTAIGPRAEEQVYADFATTEAAHENETKTRCA